MLVVTGDKGQNMAVAPTETGCVSLKFVEGAWRPACRAWLGVCLPLPPSPPSCYPAARPPPLHTLTHSNYKKVALH